MIGLCQPCKEKGKFRAPYKVIGGVPMCGGCVADREANLPAPPKPEAPQILEQAKDDKEEKGKTMDEKICKCGCGEKLRIDNQTGYRTGHKPAGGGGSSPTPKRAAAKNGGSRYAGTIEQMRAQRDLLDEAIAVLEKIDF